MTIYRAVEYSVFGEAILADCGHNHVSKCEAEECGRGMGTGFVGETEDEEQWIVTSIPRRKRKRTA